MTARFVGLAALGACVVLLNGCGDSGGGDKPTPTPSPTPTPMPSGPWSCKSSRQLMDIAASENKGLGVDDATFTWCPTEAPGTWPHSSKPVKSLRLFGGWRVDMEETGNRTATWQAMKDYVETMNAVVLMGVAVVDKEKEDEQSWQWTFGLMKLLGPERIMAVAFGNELDLNIQRRGFWAKDGPLIPQMKKRVAQMDAA